MTNVILFVNDMCIYTPKFIVNPLEGDQGFRLFVQCQRRSFEIGKDGGPTPFAESFDDGTLGRSPGRNSFLNFLSALRRNGYFHATAASATGRPDQTIPLQRPQISHERRAVHSEPIA